MQEAPLAGETLLWGSSLQTSLVSALSLFGKAEIPLWKLCVFQRFLPCIELFGGAATAAFTAGFLHHQGLNLCKIVGVEMMCH